MISVIIPFYNEVESLPILVEALVSQLNRLKKEYEIVLVDDGSTDNSISNLKTQMSKPSQTWSKLQLKSKNFKILIHKKRKGKGEALKTGVENSSGEILVFMDADLQDDPKDLLKFLEKIDQGYDLVNGIRTKRQDNILVKTYSFFAGIFLKTLLHSPFSDINCGFKVFKREVLRDFVFYGNNFRFFPLFVYYQGFKVDQVPVMNHPRQFGESKFGSKKLIGGILDMLTAYFLYKFSEKPLHFFGILGGIISAIGFFILAYLTYQRIFYHVLLYRRPILWLGILLVVVGVQIIATGIIGELIVYVNKKSQMSNPKTQNHVRCDQNQI
jgi:glycosyltransferase involved in cell wall biosynthesis